MLSSLPAAIYTNPLGSRTATAESGCSRVVAVPTKLCVLVCSSSFLLLTLHLLLCCVFFFFLLYPSPCPSSVSPVLLLQFLVSACFLCTRPVLPYVLFRSLGKSIFSNTCCPNKIVTGLVMGRFGTLLILTWQGNACFVMLWNTVFCAWFYFYLSMF